MIWLNGVSMNDEDARVSANCAGNLLGWGVFTTIGVWNARPFALDSHWQRLRHDAKIAQIEYSIDDETLAEAVRETINLNKVSRGIARISICKRGDNRWNNSSGSDVSILAQELPSKTRNDNLRVALSPFRLNSRSATSGIKTTSYLEHQLAWLEAQNRGCDEAILLNQRDEICEGARANLFFARDGVLRTPPLSAGCLPGIARHLVLKWARELEVSTREEVCTFDELLRAEEVFFTSSSVGIRRVAEIVGEKNTPFSTSGNLVSQLQNRWQIEVSS